MRYRIHYYMRRIVLDTNVLVAALRSRSGRSNRLLSLVGTDRFATAISVPLVLEYEDAAMRQIEALIYTADEVGELIDYICWASEATPIYYLWRPLLPDPKDDLVLEVAVASQCDTIVTFNHRDFKGAGTFGLKIQTPAEFLKEID